MPEDRPSRFYVLGVYAKRILRWRRNSSPFVSGDLFADMADYVYKPPRFRVFKRQQIPLQDAKIVFCRSENLQELFASCFEDINASVVICGNSDFEFHKLPEMIPPSVKALFLQNSFISDNKFVFTLPIGIENLRWGVNGNPRLLKKQIANPDNKILFGPFGNTHPERTQVIKNFSASHLYWDCLPLGRISPRVYAKIARRYKMIAAVRGNGIDTHRHWESLYRGVSPVTLRDSWSESLLAIGIPLLLIDSWDAGSISKLFSIHNMPMINPLEIDAIWEPYWRRLIQSFVN
jgi:hypothetical protein